MSGAGRYAGEAADHLLVTAQTGGTEAIDMLLSVVWRSRRIWQRAPCTCSARVTHGDPRLLATVIGLFARTAASARPGPSPQLRCHTIFLLRRRPPSGSRCDRPEHYWYARAALTEATRALALPDLPGRLQADLTAAEAAARVQLRDLQGAGRCVSESLRLGRSKNAGPPTVSAMTVTSRIAFHRGRVVRVCPWKGLARYYTVRAAGAENVALGVSI